MADRFARACIDPNGEARLAIAEGRKVIRFLGTDTPVVRIRAAGFQPVRLIAPALAETPRADAIMGAAEMGKRGRRLIEALTDPAIADQPVVITQATVEQSQIFAALRELRRLGEPVPRNVHFLDMLHCDRPASRAYSESRIARFDRWIADLGGVELDPEALDVAAADQLRLDDARERLQSVREADAISGAMALQGLAASATLDVDAFLGSLDRWISGQQSTGRTGLRVLVSGTAHETPAIYHLIEQAGARIVAEYHEWGHLPPIPARTRDPGTDAAAIAELAAGVGADLVLHLALDGDEIAPWSAGAVKRALQPGVRFAYLTCDSDGSDDTGEKLAAAVRGDAPITAAPPLKRRASEPPRRAAPTDRDASRSRKSLASVADFNAYQRDWFASVRQQVLDGAPFAMVNANAPQEILRAMDVPFVVNQWWASIVAAKQQSRRYQALLRENGYPSNVEAYSAQGIAALFDEDAENAPWGGLPHPDFVHAVSSTDPTAAIFAQWGQEARADSFVYERTVDPRDDLFPDWWVQLPGNWETAVEAERIDLLVEEMAEVIARIEATTDRRFDAARFAEVMDLVNEQEEYYRKTRDLVARTVPAPIGIVDSMPATMVPQWHRGTEWGRDAAKAFHDEVSDRIAAGQAACPGEKIRLMWVGRGLWSEMGFYQKWEESHGAVFVWSMYLALAADGYIRDLSGGRDPMRALASRIVCMGDELRMPTWAGPWHVHEAQTHQIDGAVALQDADPFVVRALRAAGFPVLEIAADNFNREGEDATGIEAAITAFIEGPARARAEARHVGA